MAVSLAAKVLSKFKQRISGLELEPSRGGCFELTAGDKLLFSKLEQGRFPNEDEMVAKIEQLLVKS